jgi:hypothetical protein
MGFSLSAGRIPAPGVASCDGMLIWDSHQHDELPSIRYFKNKYSIFTGKNAIEIFRDLIANG